MALKAILFDLDDTLIDWEGFNSGWSVMERKHITKAHRYLSGLHPDFPEEARYIDEYTTRLRDAWQNAHPTLIAPHLGKVLVDSAVSLGFPIEKLDEAALVAAYDWGAVSQTVLFPEIIEVLTQLQARGILLGIVTNSAHTAVMRDQELREHGLFDFFPLCRVTAADAGYLKPHAEIFDYALKKLNVTAEETIFVGDNPIADVAGAQGAGMRAILRQRPSDPPHDNVLIVPDAIIHSLHELLTIIDTWAAEWS